MADAGVVERAQHARVRVALDRVEHPAGKQLEEALGRAGDDLRPQAIDRVARLERRHHAAHVGELGFHGARF